MDGVSPAIVRRVAKPVAVGAVALTLARSALLGPAAAASKHAVVTLAPLPNDDSDHTRNREAVGSREQRTAEYTVRLGDNLWDIAERYYGSGEEYTRIIAANKGHTMIDAHGNQGRFSTILQPGWVLVIPDAKQQVEEEVRKRFYVVEKGDTLRRIAARLLGDERRWVEIHELNKGEARLPGGPTLTDPDLIWPGLRLEIPPREPPRSSSNPESERPTSTNKPPGGRRETRPKPGGEKPPTSAGEAERGSGNREAGPRRTGSAAGTESGEEVDCDRVPPRATGTAESGSRRNTPDAAPSPTAPAPAPPTRTPSFRPSPTAAPKETPSGAEQVEPTPVHSPIRPEQPERPHGDSIPPELVAGGVAASAAVVGGGLYLGWRLSRRNGGARARAGELREDGFVQPESSRRLAQRLHEGEFEPAVMIAERVTAFLAQHSLERVSVLTARQDPEDIHLILTGGLIEEARVFQLTEALGEALGTDVQAYATRDRDVALRVRPLEPGRWKEPGDPSPHKPLLVALGAPTPRHTLYANWRALGNVLAAGSTAGGVDTLMASIITALISRRSPRELQIRIVAEHQRLPTGLLDLPYQMDGVVDPSNREDVAEAVEAVHAELLTRMESSRDARSGKEPPQFVFVVGELADLDVDQAMLNTIALSGPEHGVRLLAATTRVMEIGRKMLPLFNTRLVLRVETEDESVELVGWDEAAGLSGGGDMLLWLGGRATIRLRAFRNEPEQLAQLGRLMRETYGSAGEDADPDPPIDVPMGAQDEECGPDTEREAVSRRENDPQIVEPDAMHLTSPEASPGPPASRQEDEEVVESAPVAVTDEATVITEERRPSEPPHAEAENTACPTIEITCFGTFTVGSGGRELSRECEVNGENSAFHKEWEVLAYVASHEPRGVSTEKMAAAIWPKNDPRTVTETTVHSVTSRLRMLLRRQVEGLEGNVIRIERRLCRLDVTRIHSDVHRFLALIQTSGPGRQAALEEAVGLYRGDLLAASAWTWVHERPINEIFSLHERFRNAFFEAAEELAETYLAQGHLRQAIPLYRRMLELDPLNEAAFLKLVECRKRTAQRAELKRDGLWVRERIRDFMYDPGDSEDNRDKYDLDPAMRVAWERALSDLAAPQRSPR